MNQYGIYAKNARPEMDPDLFRNPTSEYRGTPFWAWNCALDDEVLKEQIDIFRQMGMGGFHMHVRTGMDSPYLTDEYMAHVKVCVEQARKNGMLAWLYDEDRWPSGAAGGLVTKNADYAMRYLLFTPVPYGQHKGTLGFRLDESSGHEPIRAENGRLLAVFDVRLNPDGTLASYEAIRESGSAKGTKWYAYIESVCPSAWVNNHPYVDTLNPKAIEAFVQSTHERYWQAVGEEFGKLIPAIFTDEPQYAQKSTLSFPDEKKDLYIPWTEGFPAFFEQLHGRDILGALPELFWEQPGGGVSQMRYLYHDAVTELFVIAYCETIGRWCEAHGLMLGGHVMMESTLKDQTGAVGEAMRCYRAFKDMPGIDMLCDWHEYNTAKQAQSALHQQGGTAMLSELYGVTGWDYDFRGHKLQGDWQAALGVTVRVPHLTWMSMAGEAKRDYPACIGYQSPWYRRYDLIETHFARLNTALTRGKALVRVGVVHPIESYWLHWGPGQQTAAIRDELEENFEALTQTLLLGMIDFDFLCESCLSELCARGGAPLQVGDMAYDTIIVPGCHTLRASTLENLEAFRRAGGRLIFLGQCPAYADALESERPRRLFEASEKLDFGRAAVLDALEGERFVDIRDENGARSTNLLHQLRRDGDGLWLFIAHGKNPVSPDVDPAPTLRVTLKGEHQVTLYDTLSGETSPVDAAYEGGNTVITRTWYMHDSMLLRLMPGRREAADKQRAELEYTPLRLPKRVGIQLDEPNALIFDSAEYAIDSGPWHSEDDILHLDNACRAELGMMPRKKYVVQPYLIEKKPCEHAVRLRMRFASEVAVSGIRLALERAEQSRIWLNGQEVAAAPDGWYVDKAIQTVPLPESIVGENILEVTQPIGERAGLEFMYLLGDFGVRVEGDCKTVIPPVRTLAFGDITQQGLPFYTGNLTYLLPVECPGGRLLVRVPQYRGALIEVEIDGQKKGDIVFSPYRLEIGGLTPGKHTVGLKLYGTRQNGFAQLHHTSGVYFYQSADSWRSTGDLWVEQYQLKPAGVLKTPQVEV